MISVILALAVAQLFLGAADLIRQRSRVKFFLGHTVWFLNLFLLVFLQWWSLWAFQGLAWNFGMFFFSLIGPSLMFFAATMLNPRDMAENNVDLADYFLGIRPYFFWVVLLMSVLFLLDGPLFGTEPLLGPVRVTQFLLLAVLGWGLLADERRSHDAISLITLVILCAHTVVRFFPN
jgi:hypothetical protein